MTFTVDAIDMFCGYGGSSQGIHAAGGEVRLAANHNAQAIDVHAANFPATDHVRADLSDHESADYTDPESLPAARFLWASPSCRFHSPANARKLYLRTRDATLFGELADDFDHDLYARSERSRVTMVCPLRYAAKHHPEAVVVENVVEAAKWGPNRDGSTFRWWLDEWAKLGYRRRILFLNSMFFPPTPQSRDRMYVVFWREHNTTPDLDHRPRAHCESCDRLVDARQMFRPQKRTWPLPEWGKWGQQYDYRCPTCLSVVTPVAWPAYTAIDWTRLGAPIGDRDTAGLEPLSARTLDRVRRGLAKFAGSPAVVIPQGTNGLPKDLLDTLATQVGTGRGNGIATRGVVVPASGNTHERSGQTRARALAEPWFTQQATNALAFAHMPFVATSRGTGPRQINSTTRPIVDPLGVFSAGGRHHGLVSALWTKNNGDAGDTAWHDFTDQLGTITARDTTTLIVLPWIDHYRGDPSAIDDVLATALTRARHALAVAPPLDPDTIDLEAVRFRMLEPDPEIRRAMAFGDDYLLFGTKTQITAGLGNAVTPPVADWISGRVLSTLTTAEVV